MDVPSPAAGPGRVSPEGGAVARRTNYGAEKRQKELKRLQKQADKEEKKRLRKEGATDDTGADEAETGDGELDSLATRAEAADE